MCVRERKYLDKCPVSLVSTGEIKEGFKEEPRRRQVTWTDAIHNDSFIWARAKAKAKAEFLCGMQGGSRDTRRRS